MKTPDKFTTLASGVSSVSALPTIADNNELAFRIRKQLIELQEWVREMSK